MRTPRTSAQPQKTAFALCPSRFFRSSKPSCSVPDTATSTRRLGPPPPPAARHSRQPRASPAAPPSASAPTTAGAAHPPAPGPAAAGMATSSRTAEPSGGCFRVPPPGLTGPSPPCLPAAPTSPPRAALPRLKFWKAQKKMMSSTWWVGGRQEPGSTGRSTSSSTTLPPSSTTTHLPHSLSSSAPNASAPDARPGCASPGGRGGVPLQRGGLRGGGKGEAHRKPLGARWPRRGGPRWGCSSAGRRRRRCCWGRRPAGRPGARPPRC